MTATLVEPGYLAGQDAGTFDHRTYLAHVLDQLPDGWSAADRELSTPAARRVATRDDPMLFALVYCRNLLTGPEGTISFADLHLELCRHANAWRHRPGPREQRHAFVAPRECGKSTFVFKVLPLWAAAHEHLRFIAAFSSSATQAQKHLSGFKRQLDTNPLLRLDFPDLCFAAKRPGGGNVADSQELFHARSGFSFAAAGLDGAILGLVDPTNRRPDLLLLDDVEPDESNYSAYQAKKRLTTIMDTVLPMNERAHVALVGTVTMPDSIVHQLVKTVTTTEMPAEWIKDENFRVHYFAPIVDTADGRRSIWPGKWPLSYLESIEHTRGYKKNFKNQPVRMDGEYWTPEDFVYGDVDAVRTVLEIDPAVTSKTSSDYTGLAVVSHQPGRVDSPPRCAVRHAEQVKLPPAKLRDKVLGLLARFPEIGAVRIEVNQGGDTWRSVLHDLPVKLLVHTESAPKTVRAANLLNHYQRGRVLHTKKFPELEEQMLAFPDVLHDDLIDACGAAVRYLLRPKKRAGATTIAYAGGR